MGLTLLLCVAPAGAGLLPSFSKDFLPKTIGPGATSTLQFDISNPDPSSPVSDLAFVDNLPASVVIADAPQAFSDCGTAFLLDAPAGGGTITFSNGEVAAESSCIVTVDVTSATPGVHQNVSGDLTHSVGNSGPAIADLTVDDQRPGFGKAFLPDSIVEGDTSTLIFTIDNSPIDTDTFFLAFIDDLPAGLVVASPSNATTDCDLLGPPTLTAAPGSSSINFFSGSVGSGSSCTVSVDVLAEVAGTKGNVSGELTSGFAADSSGKASATLEVTRPFLRKLFTDDPTAPGGTATLEFTITNFDRADSATDILFSDDLNAVLSGLTASGLPLVDPCGSGSQFSGSSLLILSGGSLPPEGSCTFSVPVEVPAQAAPGSYLNTTSSVTFDRGGDVVVEDPASDDLIVAAVPTFTKSFIDDPVTGGDTVTLRFTIVNTDADNAAIDISFIDELTTFLPFPVSVTLPDNDFCGDGSSLALVGLGVEEQGLSLTGGLLAGGASCSFDALIDIPVGYPPGTFLNETTEITATIDGTLVTGNAATDTLESVAAPKLSKDFTDDPVLPGGTVTLEFTLTLTEESPGNATDIEFTDDLDAVLSGLEAVGLPLNNVCGAGSEISGTGLLSFIGGSLAPGESCTFEVTLQIPPDAIPGTLTNVTSDISAMSLGLAVVSEPAEGDLVIGGVTFTKTFIDDPVLAGDTVELEFFIENLSNNEAATGLTFSDNLDDALDGLVANGLPLLDVCGDGSALVDAGGSFVLLLQDGVLAAGTSCTFSVILQVPGDAEVGEYGNTTSSLSGLFGGVDFVAGAASDVLSVFEPLTIAKLFVDDPIPPGGIGSLEFTLTNASAQDSLTDISFTDDLDGILSGLAAVGLPADDVCGAGSQITGTGFLSFTGGSLGPSESCSFSVQVEVPVDVPLGTTVINVTSEATGLLGELVTTAMPATDDLTVDIPVCTAPDGENVVLANDILSDVLQVTVCETVEVGPDYAVGDGGVLTIRVGDKVIFFDGAAVEDGGELSVGIDPDLLP